MAGVNDGGGGGVATPEGSVDERSTERRIAASVRGDAIAVEVHEVPADDHDAAFAAHVARGSALARRGDDADAMVELEHAMALDPREPKVKDLLALVYFRLGHYTNAALLYEELRAQFPRDLTAKLNLALASMKGGDVEAARSELQEIVRANPGHRRAWGYLGMAYDWLGESELALRAFDRGRLPEMAARVGKGRGRLTVPAPSGDGEEPSSVAHSVPTASTIAGGQEGFFELDGGALTPDLANPPPRPVSEQVFAPPPPPPMSEPPSYAVTFDPSDLAKDHTTTAPPPVSVPRGAGALAAHDDAPVAPRMAFTRTLSAQTNITAAAAPPRPAAPRAPSARSRALAFPEARGVTRDATGLVLVRVQGGAAEGEGFAARLEAVRTYTATLRANVLERPSKGRGRSGQEPIGGFAAPLVRFDGAGDLVLAPRAGQVLFAVELEGERAAFREELVVGFELRLEHESVRVSLDDGEGGAGTPMLQLRGGGGVVVEGAVEIRALEIATGRGACVRREVVAGWVGALTARPLAAREAPLGQAGLSLVEGDGVLFVLAR